MNPEDSRARRDARELAALFVPARKAAASRAWQMAQAKALEYFKGHQSAADIGSEIFTTAWFRVERFRQESKTLDRTPEEWLKLRLHWACEDLVRPGRGGARGGRLAEDRDRKKELTDDFEEGPDKPIGFSEHADSVAEEAGANLDVRALTTAALAWANEPGLRPAARRKRVGTANGAIVYMRLIGGADLSKETPGRFAGTLSSAKRVEEYEWDAASVADTRLLSRLDSAQLTANYRGVLKHEKWAEIKKLILRVIAERNELSQ